MAFLGVHVYKWVARGDGVDALEVRALLTHPVPVKLEIRGLFVVLSAESQLIRSGLNPFRINPK